MCGIAHQSCFAALGGSIIDLRQAPQASFPSRYLVDNKANPAPQPDRYASNLRRSVVVVFRLLHPLDWGEM